MTLRNTLLAAVFATIFVSPAQAFTHWSKFELDGYSVTARHSNGALRYVSAVNLETGERFDARVSLTGVVTIKSGDTVRKINLDDLEDRAKPRSVIQDLAELQSK